MDDEGVPEGGEVTIVELDDAPTASGGGRRWLFAAVAGAVAIALAIAAVARPSDAPEQARAEERGSSEGAGSEERSSTTTLAEETIESPVTTTATTTPASGVHDGPEDADLSTAPVGSSPVVPPPDQAEATTTTTVPSPPWQANVIRVRSLKAAIVDGEEVQVDVLAGEEIGLELSIEGKVDLLTLDYDDGTSSSFPDADYPMACHAHLIPATLRHTWSVPGTYTITVRVVGSQDCDTDPADYRATTKTVTITVV